MSTFIIYSIEKMNRERGGEREDQIFKLFTIFLREDPTVSIRLEQSCKKFSDAVKNAKSPLICISKKKLISQIK